ncbi:MAG: acylphosphatase [Candidatus Eisenbacteria bacterium]
MRAVRVLVSGRVQGVGFRAFVLRQATDDRLAGWVRNRPDGAVECEAHGDTGALERFVEALRSGPRHARVEHAAVQWFEAAEAPDGFRVTG